MATKLAVLRAIAFLVDIIIVLGFVLILELFVLSEFLEIKQEHRALFPLLIFLYFSNIEARSGQSLGKKIFNIILVRNDGKRLSLYDSYLRSFIFLLLPVLVNFVFEVIGELYRIDLVLFHSVSDWLVVGLYIATPLTVMIFRGQGIHDVVSKTSIRHTGAGFEIHFGRRRHVILVTIFISILVSVSISQKITNVTNKDQRQVAITNTPYGDLENFLIPPTELASMVPNGEYYFDLDWDQETIETRIGPCGELSKLEFNTSPYSEIFLKNDTSGMLGNSLCVKYTIPVTFKGFTYGDFEEYLASKIILRHGGKGRFILLEFSFEKKAMIFSFKLEKKMLINSSKGRVNTYDLDTMAMSVEFEISTPNSDNIQYSSSETGDTAYIGF